MAIQKVIQIDVNSSQAKQNVDGLDQSVNKLNKDTTDLNATFEQVYGDLQPLTTRMGELEDRMYELALAGKRNTKEYRDLQAEVGRFKQTIQQTDLAVDAAALTTSQKMTGAIQGVAGAFSVGQSAAALFGVQSESLEKTMVKLQAAMALSQGIAGLNESSKVFDSIGKSASKALAGIRTGIAATGIGVLLVALGAIVVYWDDIKEAVSGVNEEQKDNLATMEEASNVSQKQLEASLSNEETLKRQGKTEEEIYQIKLKAYQKAIKAKKDEIAAEQILNRARVEATERNFNMVKKFMDITLEFGFAGLRSIASIVDLIINGVNSVSKLIGKGNIINFSANEFLTNARNKLTSFAAGKIFDVKGLKEEIRKSNEEDKKALDKLINDESTLINRRKDSLAKSKKESKPKKEGKTEEEKLKEQKEALKKIEEDHQKTIDELKADNDDKKLILQKQQALKELELVKLSEKEKAKAKALIEEEYRLKFAELDKKYKEEELKRDAEFTQKILALRQEDLNNANLSVYQKMEVASQMNDIIKNGTFATEAERTKAEAENAAIRIALNEQEFQNKVDLAYQGVDVLMKVFEENKGIMMALFVLQKAMAIGDIVRGAAKSIAQQTAAYNVAQMGAAAAFPMTGGLPFTVKNTAAYLKGVAMTKISAGIGIASILAQAFGQIKGMSGTGGAAAGGGASGGGGAVGTAAMPSPTFNIAGNTGVNQIASTLAGQQPVKAYVVAKEVTTQQELDRNKITATKI